MFIGFIVVWLPMINFIGVLLLIGGAVFAVLGRNAFGRAHARNVTRAVFIFVGGVATTLVLTALLMLVALSSIVPELTEGFRPEPRVMAEGFRTMFRAMVLGPIVGTSVAAVAAILFVYALQDRLGKLLLLTGYAAVLATGIATYFVAVSIIEQSSATVAGGTFGPAPLLDLQSEMLMLRVISAIPSALFALAYYLVWSRMERGRLRPVLPQSSVSSLAQQ